ncbi:MAG: hypothetical protein KJ043_04605 [Anaerolineae bacterium]|nr:hypothetical protein [Anaerolineae bacterium]
MPTRITDHADGILLLLQENKNRWHTRIQVAELMGRTRLTPYDIQCLELLVQMDLVYQGKEDGYSRDGYRWRYGVFDTPPTE